MNFKQLLPLRFLVMCLVFQTFGCLAMTPKFKFHEEPDLMEQEIMRVIPLGSSISEAKKIMEGNGFKCEYVEKGSFVRERDDSNAPGRVRQTSYEGIDYLYCDQSRGFIVSRRWQAAIVHEDSKVTVVAVSTALTGP